MNVRNIRGTLIATCTLIIFPTLRVNNLLGGERIIVSSFFKFFQFCHVSNSAESIREAFILLRNTAKYLTTPFGFSNQMALMKDIIINYRITSTFLLPNSTAGMSNLLSYNEPAIQVQKRRASRM